MGTDFRPARSEDAGGLVALVEALGYPDLPGRVQARLERLIARDDHAVFVAARGGELVGWIHVQEFHSLASDPIALIAGLSVDPACRRSGLGRGLVARAEHWARGRGLSSLRLRARVTRTGAHAFYRRLGFELAKEQLQFRKEL